MKISVIIPAWNRADRLVIALASVAAQSLPPHEVIVVDDGSTDSTRKVMRHRFGNVRYLYQENMGVSCARNTGIRAATGDWIALLDSDDCWLPQKLECQQSLLHANPGATVCHSDEIWIRNGKRVNPMKKHAKQGGYIFKHCLPLCVISPSSVIIQRDLFNEIGLFDESLPACEDYDLWLRICALYPVVYADKPLVIKHGGHADQLSQRYWGMDRFRIRALEKILASGILNAENHAAARAMLLEKIRIVVQGADKRDNTDLANTYRGKLHHYSQAPAFQAETTR